MSEAGELAIARVTVHPDGALVRRAGELPVADGRLVVRRLPLMLDPSSVRVAVSGGTLVDARVQLDVQGLDREGPVASEESLREATDALRALDVELSALSEERAGLAELGPERLDDPEVALPSADRLSRWPAIDRALSDWAAEIDEKVRELRRRREDLQEEVSRLATEVRQQSTEAWWRRWAPTRRVVVRVETDSDHVSVEVSYRVPGATWSPAYTLDTDAVFRTGRLTMRALVVQGTGEDWTDAALALSTAPCARTVDLPDLPALKLGTHQPPPRPAWRELPAGLDGLFPADLVVPPRALGAPEPPPEPDEDVTIDSLERDEEATLPEGGPPDILGDLDDDLTPLAITEEVAASDMPVVAPAAPQSASMPEAVRSRAASWFGSAPSGSAGPPPQAAPAPRRRARRRAPAAPPPPEQLETPTIDYGRLRLADWTAPPGRRGRLQAVDEAGLLVEAGLPPLARERLQTSLREGATRAAAARDRPLPPHHVLPDPAGGADHCWRVDGTADIPSDGRFHAVAVATAETTLQVTYRAVPRHDPRAFRQLEATLELDGPLLPGPVDVFVDGALEVTTPWQGTPGRGQLQLGLGVEDRLTLARNVRYREESAGLFGGSRRLHTTIEVQVASSLPRPVNIELLERIPVAQDADDVEVSVGTCSPTAYEWEGDDDGPLLKGGRRQWLEVAPGGEARAVITYAVTIANRDELVGGDRRG